MSMTGTLQVIHRLHEEQSVEIERLRRILGINDAEVSNLIAEATDQENESIDIINEESNTSYRYFSTTKSRNNDSSYQQQEESAQISEKQQSQTLLVELSSATDIYEHRQQRQQYDAGELAADATPETMVRPRTSCRTSTPTEESPRVQQRSLHHQPSNPEVSILADISTFSSNDESLLDETLNETFSRKNIIVEEDTSDGPQASCGDDDDDSALYCPTVQAPSRRGTPVKKPGLVNESSPGTDLSHIEVQSTQDAGNLTMDDSFEYAETPILDRYRLSMDAGSNLRVVPNPRHLESRFSPSTTKNQSNFPGSSKARFGSGMYSPFASRSQRKTPVIKTNARAVEPSVDENKPLNSSPRKSPQALSAYTRAHLLATAHCRKRSMPMARTGLGEMAKIAPDEYERAPRIIRMQLSLKSVNQAVDLLKNEHGFVPQSQLQALLKPRFPSPRPILMGLCHWRRLVMHQQPEGIVFEVLPKT